MGFLSIFVSVRLEENGGQLVKSQVSIYRYKACLSAKKFQYNFNCFFLLFSPAVHNKSSKPGLQFCEGAALTVGRLKRISYKTKMGVSSDVWQTSKMF